MLNFIFLDINYFTYVEDSLIRVTKNRKAPNITTKLNQCHKNDGVSTGSPLRLALANIFVGFHWKGLLSRPNQQEVYFRYIDDTFCHFNSDTDVNLFFTSLNNIEPAIRYTLDRENNFTLPFLDVLFCRNPYCYVPSIYRKPTFTNLYSR